MVAAAEYPLAPAAEFLAALSAWTWIDSTPEGLVAFLLVAHPQDVEQEMVALAMSLGMATPDLAMPDLGARLLCSTTNAVLEVPGSSVRLLVPASGEWSGFARGGGPVVVLISTTPLARDADLMTVSTHLMTALLPRQVWMGKTRVRYGSAEGAR